MNPSIAGTMPRLHGQLPLLQTNVLRWPGRTPKGACTQAPDYPDPIPEDGRGPNTGLRQLPP